MRTDILISKVNSMFANTEGQSLYYNKWKKKILGARELFCPRARNFSRRPWLGQLVCCHVSPSSDKKYKSSI